jgi:Clostripain family
MPMVGIACVAPALFLFSCSSIPPAHHATPLGDDGGLPPRYSIVCIIHGDGDYLYHDAQGDAHRADEVTLAEAKTVAERNRQAEMFIFHERPRRHLLPFIPRRDGTLYYYRHGRLIAEESYWRDKGVMRFDPEMELYNRFRVEKSPEMVRFFLYFGHEIPEFGGAGYDASYKKRTFTVCDLADALRRIARDSTKVDLVVLSTCFSGTPRTIAAVTPYARYVIASPDNLHLSYFDLHPFEDLDTGLRERDVSQFANSFAHHAFDRLTADIQTTVTVVVYDVDRVQGFVDSVDSTYEYALNTLKGQTPASVERCDCAEDPAYALPGMDEGITVLYRPARFGRSKYKESHSGWECLRRTN